MSGTGRRHALLVATGEYTDARLGRLRAPDQDVERLAAVLEDPDAGAFDDVRVLRDAPDFEIRAAVEDVLADRAGDDLVLVYFSCHGFVSAQGQLYFAATNTRTDRPAGSAVPASYVNDQLQNCAAAGRLLLLDACFSGAFTDGFKAGTPDVMDGRVGDGYVVITACDRYEYAYEADSMVLESPRASVFTDAVLETLTGDAAPGGEDGWITVDEFFKHVQDGVLRRQPEQRPRFFAHAAEPHRMRLVQKAARRSAGVAVSGAPASAKPVASTYTQNQLVVARGIKALAEPIGRTLGPMGRRVILRDGTGIYQEAADSLAIAEQSRPDDPRDAVGMAYVRDLVLEMRRTVGDGAATAAAIGWASVRGMMDAQRRGARQVRLLHGLRAATDLVREQLTRSAIRPDLAALTAIATEVCPDPGTSALVAEAVLAMGAFGAVHVEEANGFGIDSIRTAGLRIDSGYMSGHFVTHAERAEAVLDDAYLLVTDLELSSVHPLVPLLEKIMSSGKPLLVVARDVRDETMATLVVNKVRETLKSVAVKLPTFPGGAMDWGTAQDLAVATGATLVTARSGPALESLELSHLGTAVKVVMTKDRTLVSGAGGKPELTGSHVNALTEHLPRAASPGERAWYQHRIDRLTHGLCVIRVGGETQEKLTERVALVERILLVCRLAYDQGVIPGGGAGLARAAQLLEASEGTGREQAEAAAVLAQALQEPYLRIGANAGYEEDEMLQDLHRTPSTSVFDVRTGGFRDLAEAGLFTPVAQAAAAIDRAAGLTERFLMVE
ncbi:TCP-1/cpn60 chaperonin family protein [Kitasatospora sp. NPDC088391]|uniref:caspase, EACC1-associated type n=1 Tax=Kitasatospora sp. NPDC088391 TaxID=3364074 RepID=UPI00381D53C5